MALDITTLSVKVQAQGINDTAKALDNLALSAEKAEKSADRLGEKFSKSSTGILAIKTAMEGMKDMMSKAFPTEGAQALNRALGELSATLKTIKGKKIDIDVGGVGRDAEVARKGVESLNRSLMEGHNVFQVVGKSLYQLRNMLGGTMLFAALQNTTGGVIALSDAWSLMQAKLKMALGSSEAAKNMQEKLYKAAMTLRVPLDELARLFTRLVPAMKDYGYSAEDALKVTTSLAAALKVSGATMAESASVMLQFSQAMQSGRLNGAEFNAVAEGAPIILRAISLEAGKTRGQLKQMGADGQLGVELIAKTLLKWQPIWEDMAKKMPMTVEAAMGNLTTAFTKFFGIANETFGVTQKLAGAIQWVAENIDVLGKLVGAITAGLIAALIVKLSLLAVVTLSNAAAASALGIAWFGTAGSITVATVATGMLSAALNTLKVNPIILAISAITALGVGMYAFASKSVSPLKEVYDNIDRINEAHPDSKGKFEAFTKEIEKLDKQIADGYRNYEKLKKQQESSFSTESAKAMTEEMKIQAKAIAKLEEAQKLYEQQIGSTKKTASDAHAKFMQEHKVQMQQLDVEGNIKRRMSSTEVDMLKKANELRQEIDLNGEGSQRAQEIRVEIMALANKANEEKRVGDAIDAVTKSTKEAAKAEESIEKKYTKQLNSVNAFIEKQEEELGLRRKLTEAEAEAAKVQEFLDTNKSKGSAVEELKAMREKILANGQMKVTQEELNKAFDIYRSKKLLDTQAAENTRIETANMQDQVEMLTLLNDETYKSVLAIEMRKQALQSLSIAAVEAATNEMKLEQDRIEASKNYSEEDKQKRIQGLQEQIEANNRIIKQYNDLLPLQKQLTEGMLKASQIKMQEIGRSPAQILADGFGEAGKAISEMTTAYTKFGDEATKINKYVADKQAALMAKGMGKEDARIEAEKDVADKRIQVNAEMYASLAGAAKGFFSENSKGYQAMAKAEKAFRTIELALAVKNAVTKMALMGEELAAFLFGETSKSAAEETTTGTSIAMSAARGLAKATEAIAGAFVGVGPTGFITGAAMIAIMAGLGFAVSGGGGGKTTMSAEDTQKAQGAGTVFGDSSAKSESAVKALELVADNSEISLSYNAGMLAALKNIESNITNFANLIVRQNLPKQLRTSGDVTKKGQGRLLDSGGFVAKALFGFKKSVTDVGLEQTAQTMKDILTAGLNIVGYQDIETKTKRYGRTKTSNETVKTSLSEEVTNQFEMVVKSMGSSVIEAAKALKMDGSQFTDNLDSFVVDIGRISLKDMSAEDIQKTIGEVFSKLGDQMAEAVLPGFEDFQKIGEGYMETLIRVASTVATVDGIFAEVGTTFGTTGMEAIKAKMDLVELAGGIQELSSMVGNFFDKFYTEAEKKAVAVTNITTKMADLGVQGFDPLAENARVVFRSMVENAKETNPKLMVELLKLSDAVDSVAPAFKKAADAAEIAEKALSQQDGYNKLTMSSSEYLAYARGKELEAMDESLRPMQKRIYALQDEAKITEQKTTLEDTYNKIALSGTALLTYNRNLELAKMDESLRPLQMRIYALQDEKTALEDMKKGASGALAILDKSVVAQKKILKDDLDGKLLNINSAKDAGDARFEAEKAKLEATKTISDEYYATQQEAAANAVTSIKEYRDELKTLFDDISSAVDKLTNNNKQLQAISYNAAKAQIDSVLATAKSTGQLPDSKSFKDVLDSFTSLSESDFSTMLDFQREQLVSAGKLSQLGGVAGGKLSAAESAVIAAEANVKATKDAAKEAADRYTEEVKSLEDKHKLAIGYYDSSIKALQTQYDLDVEFYDNLLQNAKDQLDIANGTYIATIGVRDAVDYFGTALGMYVAAKDADQARLVDQVNQMGLKTTGYEDALAKQESDKQALVTEMAGLREDLAAQNKAIATNTLATAKVLQRWDGDGQPEVRNVA